MAVTESGPPSPDPKDPSPDPVVGETGPGSEAPEARVAAPGRGVHFVVDTHRKVGYRIARFLVELFVRIWFRPTISGAGRVPETGPVLITPVHRSFADFVFTSVITDRKLFFMIKDSMWKSRLLGRVLVSVGGFPVHRESADRQALLHAEDVLRHDAVLVIFPEGTRQEGPAIEELLEGAAFLAARTGATLVPLGIGNSEKSMPKGSRIPKPLKIKLVVGEPIAAPERSAAGRVSRSKVRATNEQLRAALQAAYDEARS